MDPIEFQVVVVRAWREPEGLRIRLLADGHPPRQWVTSSIADTCAILAGLLAALLAAPGPSAVPDQALTPPDTGD
jgi:hypothetical protein